MARSSHKNSVLKLSLSPFLTAMYLNSSSRDFLSEKFFQILNIDKKVKRMDGTGVQVSISLALFLINFLYISDC